MDKEFFACQLGIGFLLLGVGVLEVIVTLLVDNLFPSQLPEMKKVYSLWRSISPLYFSFLISFLMMLSWFNVRAAYQSSAMFVFAMVAFSLNAWLIVRTLDMTQGGAGLSVEEMEA